MVDLSEVAFMDSTGINALIGAYRRTPHGGCLQVVGAKSAVRRVFEITGVSELLLLEPHPLASRQVTDHTCDWRQWMTEEATKRGQAGGGDHLEIRSPGREGKRRRSLRHGDRERSGRMQRPRHDSNMRRTV